MLAVWQHRSGRNPLKTGLVTASLIHSGLDSPERVAASQSPENGSRHCKGGGGFFFSSPLYRLLTSSFPPTST